MSVGAVMQAAQANRAHQFQMITRPGNPINWEPPQMLRHITGDKDTMQAFKLKAPPAFNLDYTLCCGQVFRWRRQQDGAWQGVLGANAYSIKQDERAGLLFVSGYPRASKEDVRHYFRFDEDWGAIIREISVDGIMKKATNDYYGLRVVRQDAWECLISYICSVNNNIPKIQTTIERLCEKFGEPILDRGAENNSLENSDCKDATNGSLRSAGFGFRRYFSFPKPNVLARAPLPSLKRCILGFRAPWVKNAAKLVASGDFDLRCLRKMPYLDARKVLTSGALLGVGPKVADCVLLFSCEKAEAFPVDVWIRRFMRREYGIRAESGRLSKKEYNRIADFARDRFGRCAGYAQEYLYHYGRNQC